MKGKRVARKLVSSGSEFERLLGYSRAVRDGEWVFVSGTTGFNYKTHTIADGVVEQTRQMIENIRWGLGQAGARFEHLVRVRLYMADAADVERVAPLLSKVFRAARPAETLITARFADPRILIEMDATALVRERGARPKRPRPAPRAGRRAAGPRSGRGR